MGIDGAAFAQVFQAPHLLQDLLAAQDAAGIAEEISQQLELPSGEVHQLAVHPRRVHVEVHGDGAEGQLRSAICDFGGHRAPEDGPQAGCQLPGREGFGYIVVRAELEAEHPVDLFAPGGDEQHGEAAVRSVGPDGPQHIEAVHVGQAQIEQGRIEPGTWRAEGLEGIPAGAHAGQAEALPAQMLLETQADLGVVFQEENVGHGTLRRYSTELPRRYGCLAFRPSRMKRTSSAMLVASSAMRSQFLMTRIRWLARSMQRGSASMMRSRSR